MPNLKADFGDCPYLTEIETIFRNLADGEDRHRVLHAVTKLGKRLSGVHRHRLVDLAYAELDRREAPDGGNQLVSSGRMEP
jgi:hypothetical protein